jgi:hypothetical protein
MESGDTYPRIFNVGTRPGESLAPRSVRFLPEEKSDTHWIGGCMGLRVGLDVVAERKILPCRNRTSVLQPVLFVVYLTTLFQ